MTRPTVGLTKWIGTSLGEAGLAVLAAVSGIADVDAIPLSLARLSRDGTANPGPGDPESAPVRVVLPAEQPVEVVIADR